MIAPNPVTSAAAPADTMTSPSAVISMISRRRLTEMTLAKVSRKPRSLLGLTGSDRTAATAAAVVAFVVMAPPPVRREA